MSYPTSADFEEVARDIQNRQARPIGTVDIESRRFREFFGASSAVVTILWHLLLENELLPKNSSICHLLWALYFLKVYPKQGPACSVVGGTKSAVDPKTFRKWVWEFIFVIAELEVIVVSLLYKFVLHNTE